MLQATPCHIPEACIFNDRDKSSAYDNWITDREYATLHTKITLQQYRQKMRTNWEFKSSGIFFFCCWSFPSRSVITYKYNTSVNNTTLYFIYNGIYVRVTCFDLVGHPQALQENRSKSYLVFLHCGIPQFTKTKQLLDLFSWRAWGWPTRSKHVALTNFFFFLVQCHHMFLWTFVFSLLVVAIV